MKIWKMISFSDCRFLVFVHAGERILVEEIAHVCPAALKCQTVFHLSPTSIHFFDINLSHVFGVFKSLQIWFSKNLPSSTHVYPYPTNHIASLGFGCLHCRPRGLPRSSLVKKVNTLLPLKPRCRPREKAEDKVSFSKKTDFC